MPSASLVLLPDFGEIGLLLADFGWDIESDNSHVFIFLSKIFLSHALIQSGRT